MKKLLALLILAGSLVSAWSATSINSVNKFAYGADFGWMDWRGDTAIGAVIGEYVCAGYLDAANVGWINLGSGTPANGIQYQNNSGTDYGVNQDGQGNLRGYAYGANIGWINFENNGAAKVDLKTGKLSGSIYSANCGWISLSNSFAFVQTDTIAPSAVGTNGLPIAWMLTYFGTTNVNADADPDGDGVPNMQEYLAGTNPNDGSDRLAITAFAAAPGGTLTTLTWKSSLTRCYFLEKNLDLTTSLWLDSGLGIIAPDGASTMRAVADTDAPMRYYRVRAVRPLSP